MIDQREGTIATAHEVNGQKKKRETRKGKPTRTKAAAIRAAAATKKVGGGTETTSAERRPTTAAAATKKVRRRTETAGGFSRQATADEEHTFRPGSRQIYGTKKKPRRAAARTGSI